MNDNNYLINVRSQYEELPYPERKPLDELKRILMTYFDGIDRINHICHGGMKDFTDGARILIAGGGTGDSTIFLAEQLRDTNSEIVYLDFSKASLEVTRERANVRGLENITWIHDSILNIPSLGLGAFDHINCTGVLHHLDNPSEGLRVLENSLASDGSMHLMVYAAYGRTVVYQIQNLLKLINKGESDTGIKIENCRKLMNSFHDNHWYQFVKHAYANLDDTELYDLFLHSQDRAYTIPELYDFVESAGLRIVKLLYGEQGTGSFLYEPRRYLQDNSLLDIIDGMPTRDQQAIAEILNGLIGKHALYVARSIISEPDSGSLDFIPSLPVTSMTVLADYQHAHQQAMSPSDNVVITVKGFGTNVVARKTPHMCIFFSLLDGRCTLKEIYDEIIASSQDKSLDYQALENEFEELFSAMKICDYLPMRHKSIPKYVTAEEIQRRMMI